MDSGQGASEAEVVLEELTIDDDVSTGERTEADVSADDVFEELDIDDASKRVTAAEPVVEKITVEPEAKAVVEEAVAEAEPEAETVVEEAVTEPEVEAVVEETAAEPEAETVVEEAVTESEVEAVVEETAVEPETEAVVEEAATEPEVETVVEEAVTEPESEVVVEEIPMEPETEAVVEEAVAEAEPEAETVAEEPVAEESAAETAEEQKAEMTSETTEPAADEAAEESESGATAPAEDAPSEETAPEPVDAEESETAPEETALTEASEEAGSKEVGPEETAAVSEAADFESASDEAAEAQEAEEADAAADPASEGASSEETDPATDRTPQVLEERPIQPFWSVEEPEEARTPVGIVKFVSGALVFVALLAAAYVYGINYYGTHFLPNTYLDGVDVGEMTAAEAKDALRSSFEDYSFTLTGRNGAAEDLDISAAAPAREYEGVEGVLSAQNRVGWIFARTPVKETSLPYTGTFDEEGLDKALDQSALLAAENIAPPENAYITFDPESNHYTIVPEVPGNAVDREVLTKAMGEKLREGQTALDMEEIGCYIAPAISADNARLNQDLAELNTLQDLGASIDMGGEVTEYLNGEQLREMISGESAVSAYVTGLKDRYDTYDKDKRRLFRTAEGTYILMNASYGWRLDEETTLKDLLALTDKAADTVGKSFDLEGILKAMEEAKAAKSKKSSKSSKDSKKTEENADPFHITASWTNKAAVHDEQDYGTTYAEVDLTNQTVYVIQDGQTIFTSPCVSGRMTKDRKTPPGIFDIKLKQTNKTLVGYKPDGSVDYRSPVNYWMPFNGGVGFHDATWRGSFGGTIYVNSGSHGCINMPLAKARELYGLVYKGMPVIVYYR